MAMNRSDVVMSSAAREPAAGGSAGACVIVVTPCSCVGMCGVIAPTWPCHAPARDRSSDGSRAREARARAGERDERRR